MSLTAKTLLPAAALLAVLPLSACGGSLSVGLANSEKDQRTYTVSEKVTSMKVTGHTGRVEIVGADVPTVKVTENLRFTKNGRPDVKHEVTGGALEMSYSCPGSISLSGHVCEVDYRITVPRALAAELRTDTGAIVVSGMTGSVTARANTGTITGTGLRPVASAHISARTDTGSVRLSMASAAAEVSARANTGHIKIVVPGAQKFAVSADTNTGEKQVNIPTDPGAPHTIKAQTDTGDVTISAA
ncbi:DUF4097 family beta strand repeat-containing protein [Actinomadura harenae]|uniref:Uncharacterized protein n=1 Tax=Actinomadura harenae TaxID=2483351 RepID=A0A3M2M890_9ACTN|nr:DUF4097 family beta strand repeat-containing protein [Actinomadura harenae]RMI45732.1 hypothetical protein EBO15_09080 [Actinomadura harenae]